MGLAGNISQCCPILRVLQADTIRHPVAVRWAQGLHVGMAPVGMDANDGERDCLFAGAAVPSRFKLVRINRSYI